MSIQTQAIWCKWKNCYTEMDLTELFAVSTELRVFLLFFKSLRLEIKRMSKDKRISSIYLIKREETSWGTFRNWKRKEICINT